MEVVVADGQNIRPVRGIDEIRMGITDPSLPLLTVYKSATCGCCKDWVKHMQDNDRREITWTHIHAAVF